jgi:hypothetical protein
VFVNNNLDPSAFLGPTQAATASTNSRTLLKIVKAGNMSIRVTAGHAPFTA